MLILNLLSTQIACEKIGAEDLPSFSETLTWQKSEIKGDSPLSCAGQTFTAHHDKVSNTSYSNQSYKRSSAYRLVTCMVFVYHRIFICLEEWSKAQMETFHRPMKFTSWAWVKADTRFMQEYPFINKTMWPGSWINHMKKMYTVTGKNKNTCTTYEKW